MNVQRENPMQISRKSHLDDVSNGLLIKPDRRKSGWLTLRVIFCSVISLALTLTPTATATPGNAVPTLVQHVATGMDRYPLNTLTITLPNPVGGGNCLILGTQFNSVGSVSSVTDDKGNTWVVGPTTTNVTYSKRMNSYYVLNAISGTQTIVIHFSGLASTPGFPQAVVSEFYNVAIANAFDGSAASSVSRTTGTIVTTGSGDLIYEWGASLSSSNATGGAWNGATITAGTNFTLLSADLQVGSGDQYYLQPSAGSITPTFAASGSATWGSLAIALKPAQAGTPPGSGIRIVHVQHTLLASAMVQGRSNPIMMQFPSSGNLLIGTHNNSQDHHITSITDSLGNTWSRPDSALSLGQNHTAQVVYAANAATAPTLGNINVSIANPGTGDDFFILYDVTGAATSPFDVGSTNSGNHTVNAPLTSGTITPISANGLVIHVNSIYWHTIQTLTSPVGGGCDVIVNDLDDDDYGGGYNGTHESTLDMDNGYAHYYNPNTSAISFTFIYAFHPSGHQGVTTWGGRQQHSEEMESDQPRLQRPHRRRLQLPQLPLRLHPHRAKSRSLCVATRCADSGERTSLGAGRLRALSIFTVITR